MDEYDIYLDFCGCQCPCPQKKCSSLEPENVCGLEELWLDCDEFQDAFSVDIADAEDEIDSLGLDDDYDEEDW